MCIGGVRRWGEEVCKAHIPHLKATTYVHTFSVLKLQDLHLGITLQWPVKVPQDTVHFGNHCIVCQAFTDLTSNIVGCGLPRLAVYHLPIRQSHLDWTTLLGRYFCIVLGLQLLKQGYTLSKVRRRGLQLHTCTFTCVQVHRHRHTHTRVSTTQRKIEKSMI